jgi:hypothetical protein
MTTWTIAQLERNADDDGVVTAHYHVSKTEGDYRASSYGTCSWTPEPSTEGFVPFEDLTEAMVIEWVKSSLDVDAIEANLTAQIEDQKAPKVVAGVPWA